MYFPQLNRYFSGVSVPVSALWSVDSQGVGDFLDLKKFGRWCSDAGFDVLQILPVNDTGFESSPYSALSAFALHPIYLNLEALQELDAVSSGQKSSIGQKIAELKRKTAKPERVKFQETLTQKLDILRALFSVSKSTIINNEHMKSWMEHNPWIKPYGLYRVQKDRNQQRSWTQWETMRDIRRDELDKSWENSDYLDELYFYSWLQYRLEEQLADAARTLNDLGVFLKGDIPILLNEDSTDVWFHREYFQIDYNAGAPPDEYSRYGQNWGFPVYNWPALEAEEFSWWKSRLEEANKFFNAFRIDHVLGFFRIWTVRASNTSGALGFFDPKAEIVNQELFDIGFDEGRVRWLSQPHVSGEKLRSRIEEDSGMLLDECLTRIGDEDLFLFNETIDGEKDLLSLSLSNEQKEILLEWFRDRCLIKVSEHSYVPAWLARDSSSYRSLFDEERRKIETLFEIKRRQSEEKWKTQGNNLLRMMRESVPMLPCAEDLGAIPSWVPNELERLKILGLRIPRWHRKYGEPGSPFVPLEDYPFLTVCTPSVHDTSTMRGWWEEQDDLDQFWRTLGFEGDPPVSYDIGTAHRICEKIFDVNSAILMFQIQDIYDLSKKHRSSDPSLDRINVPGTLNEKNWTYKINTSIEALQDDGQLSSLFATLNQGRKRKEIQ